jgi:hypothetical protein
MPGCSYSCWCDNSSMSDWDIETPARRGDAPTAAETPPPPDRRRWRLRLKPGWIAIGVVMLLVGVFAGFYLARSQSGEEAAQLTQVRQELSRMEGAVAQSEERVWYYYRTVQALTAENEALRGESAGPPGSGPASTAGGEPAVMGDTYGDGVYLVGEDILPGTYDGVVIADVGYWARLKGTDGALGSIITNAITRGPFVLTIIESDMAVELRGVRISVR